ncbi:MAG: hypothetical protein O7G85_05635 [Planctomycetota bacterium]|nr:hypothetical protein [Planctomycetota bacterium]
MGARLIGTRADAMRRPLLAYGVLEIIIAGLAALIPWEFELLFKLSGVLSSLSETSPALAYILRLLIT